MLRGIDISDWQGTFNAAQVKASGIDFVIHKASEGTSGTQQHYAERRAACKAVGLSFGAYYFSRPDVCAAVPEADHFLAVLKTADPPDFVAGDFEQSGVGKVTNYVRASLAHVEAGFGQTPWFYSGGWWISAHLDPGATDLQHYPLWDAAYQGTEPSAPAPFASVSMWQHTDAAVIPGVGPGGVDEDYEYATFTGTVHPATGVAVIANTTGDMQNTPASADFNDLAKWAVYVNFFLGLTRDPDPAGWDAHIQEVLAAGFTKDLQDILVSPERESGAGSIADRIRKIEASISTLAQHVAALQGTPPDPALAQMVNDLKTEVEGTHTEGGPK